MAGACLLFDTVEDFQSAMAAHGDQIMGDIPNDTHAESVIYVAEITAGG